MLIRSVYDFLFRRNMAQNCKLEIAQNAVSFIKKVFDANDVKFKEIGEIYTISAGDYSDLFFNKVKQSIENSGLISEQFEEFSWNKPHLHFKLIIVDDIYIYVAAIVYPYEITQSHKVLWIYKLDEDVDQNYLKQLKRTKIS